MFFIFLLFFYTFLTAHIEQFHLTDGWYPTDQKQLQQKVAELLERGEREYPDVAITKKNTIRAIIVPHAGYAYSGSVAAGVYAQVKNNSYDRIILLAPDHQVRHATIVLPSFTQYKIPTGTLTIDTAAVDQLKKQHSVVVDDAVFKTEHSWEVQLPFIYALFSNTKLLPILVGGLDCTRARTYADMLKPFITERTLVVVTTDFIHYGKRYNYSPFADHQLLRIRALDGQLIDLIEQKKCAPFADFVHQKQATICGVYAVQILLALCEQNVFGAVEPRLVAYDMSAKSDGQDSVSYVGMVFTTESLNTILFENRFTSQEKKNLSAAAHDVLIHLFDADFALIKDLYQPIPSLGLKQQYGAFVTLTKKANGKKGDLRGCIGRIQTPDPLYKTIITVTEDTALRDPRFPPVTKEEMPTLDAKISILSPAWQIDSYKKIEIGKHGIILHQNGASALFLPEVAVEQHWTLEETLNQLAQKAGLKENAWQEPKTTFEVFTALDIAVPRLTL